MKMPSLSLPTRLSLAVTLVLVATTVVADAMAVVRIRASLAETLSQSLDGMIRRLAGRLDRELADMARLLDGEARLFERLSPQEAHDALVRKGSVLDFVFDHGVALVNAAGIVVAETDPGREREGMNVAEYEFFQRSYALNRSLVSEPFAAPDGGNPPVVVFTSPLRDADGKMTGMLVGGIELLANRLSAQITGVRASRFGQIGVFTRDGLVVAHTDPSLILRAFENPMPPSSPPGGPIRIPEITTADGVKALLAVAELENADWLVAGVFPSRELYGAIDSGFASAHRWFAVGLAAACALVWIISGSIVRDLERLTREVRQVAGASPPPAGVRLQETYRNEAGMLAGAVNDALASLDHARREVEDLSARLSNAEERERRRVAADLHDSVSQTLALANMRMGDLRRRLGTSPDAARLDEARRLVEQAVGEIRTLTSDLSPGILYELGLGAALEWYAEQFAKKYGLAASASCSSEPGERGGELAVFLYRAAGELMTNAAKHAGATRVTAEVKEEGGEVILAVADDGKGMDGSEMPADSFGLRHLRERARHFGGSLDIAANPGGGTVVRVRVAGRNGK